MPEVVPGPPGAEPENRPPSGEASTAHISLVSRQPSLLSEQRALPTLPRRTTPLPTLKALFPQSTQPRFSPPPGQPSTEAAESAPTGQSGPWTSVETLPGGEEVKEPAGTPHDADAGAPISREEEDLAAIWLKMGQLNEELARVVHERDHAVNEGNRLREQLRQAQEAQKEQGSPALAQELSILAQERDQTRREYAEVRKQFETLKLEQTPKEHSGKSRKELEEQLDGFRQKLEERNREIAELKDHAGGAGEGDEKLKQEAVSLREQLTRVKAEASMAQRALILSQKALHETRDTLREATEGTMLSRHNFDNLKNECAALMQQNTVLQAQNEQLTRDLAAAKAKPA